MTSKLRIRFRKQYEKEDFHMHFGLVIDFHGKINPNRYLELTI